MFIRFFRLVLVVCALIQSGKTIAACAINNPMDCVRHPENIGGGEALGRYEVTIRNNCNQTIYAAIEHVPIPRSNCSHLSSPCECGGCWTPVGYWKIGPGQSRYVSATKNRTMYIHAHTENREINWGDSNHRWSVNGEVEKFFEVTLPNSFSRVTRNLTCK